MALQGSEQTGLGSVPTAAGSDSPGEQPPAGVTQIIPGPGIGVSPPGGTGAVTVTNTDPASAQTLQATWAVATTRYYALDTTNGDDAHVGYSDVSCADAGTKAKKTVAALAAIWPRVGANRKVVVVLASGTYADSLDTFLTGTAGYQPNFPLIIGTCTNATSGAVAFSGSAADRIQAGYVVPAGFNAPGYNPLAGATSTTMGLQQVGGAAPAFAAEPAAPLGYRIRFDAATSTVALRNVCAPIVGVPTNASLNYMPIAAAPSAADVFYIEKPGVILTAGRTVNVSMTGAPLFSTKIGFDGPQIVGLDMTDTFLWGSGNYRLCGVRHGGITRAVRTGDWSPAPSYNDEAGTTRAIGGAVRVENLLQLYSLTQSQPNGQGTLVVLGTFYLLEGSRANFGAGSSGWGGSLLDEINLGTSGVGNIQPFQQIGNITIASLQPWPTRFSGTIADGAVRAALNINAAALTLGGMAITGAGNFPAIALTAMCWLTMQGPGSATGAVTGSTGNNDVGLDLRAATGAQVFLPNGIPTVTGALGDVRLADGTIITWAQAAAGVIDTNGNMIFAAGNGPTHPIPVASGAVAVAITNAPAGSPAAPARYVKFPDGAGGFYTFPSLT